MIVSVSRRWILMTHLAAIAGFALCPGDLLRADCTLTNTGNVPLPEMGYQLYQGFGGGLYPNYANSRPPDHFAAGLEIANHQIQPRAAAGNPDAANGKIVLLSVGMSNTAQEWATKGTGAFKRQADLDPSKNPQVVVVNGAQGGQDATRWTNANATTWNNVQMQLNAAGVTSNQVQALWLKQALAGPLNYGAFPAHAQALQIALERIARAAKARYPNLKIVYVSPRTRAYRNDAGSLNPEPFAYESGFSVKWMIANQISGDPWLNFDPEKGAVVAPYLSCGPYVWADGTAGRSDGFVWLCSDLETDFTHPNTNGAAKVGSQLLAFFKTDPTATPWFLRQTVVGQPPTCTASADVTNGVAPLMVNFSAEASDPDGTIRDYQWTFDDGTFSTNATPRKIFKTPGTYAARVTVTDNDGNAVTRSVTVNVAAVSLSNPSFASGQFQFTVLGATNYDYVVQCSEDMSNWIPASTNRGPFMFTEINLVAPQRFYRARLQP